tara:strand:+ start:1311 stop:1898 length:588 start_codon:yes stop_codon:yes gene_type:complete
MKTTTLLTRLEINEKAQELCRLIFGGLDMWIKAGDVLVKMIDNDSEIISKLCTSNTELTRPLLNKFEKIGRKVYDPRLIFRNCVGYTRARKLPYSTQQKLLKDKIKVAISPTNDDHRLVDLGEMTPSDARIVFAQDKVRTINEQRAFIKADTQATDLKKAVVDKPYIIHKGEVTFRKGTTLDIAGMAAIINQMTK